MVDVVPFKGIKFNFPDLRDLITEPYDKIPKDLQKKYYQRNPYNFIRLNLPDESDPYNSAKVTLEKWLKDGILVEDESPYFYEYVEEFTVFGSQKRRRGMFAIVKMEEYEKKKIYPHERTFSGPKEDRLKMLRATNTDLEPVFFLYDDPSMEIVKLFDSVKKEKDSEVTDENGVRHIIYKLKSHEITAFFKNRELVIADGHHRYETALAYSKEKREVGKTGYIMAVLVNRHDPGLVILPSHRVITSSPLSPTQLLDRLNEYFEIKEIPTDSVKDPLQADMIYYFRGHAFELRLKQNLIKADSKTENINVSTLNKYVVSKILNITNRETIKFTRWVAESVGQVDRGEAAFAFLVKPVGPSTVWDAAMNGEVMPEKSTDFYPKLISGLKLFNLQD